jgi:hypothetical protein
VKIVKNEREHPLFTSSLPVKRGGSLSFLGGIISNVLVMEIGWTDMWSGGYILVRTVILVSSAGLIVTKLITCMIYYQRQIQL